MCYKYANEFTHQYRDQNVVLVPSVLAGLLVLANILLLSTLALWKAKQSSLVVQADTHRANQVLLNEHYVMVFIISTCLL
jgi:hypothetical protein